uniref:KIB1-4 beta-propeller domain-containing protein n=1 Tax=Oryza punctata TaxID=4537 RepID=A0A0E0MLU0_ORYPU
MAEEFPPPAPSPPHPAPMPDAEPPPPWANLPIHIVRGIASRLLCKIDRRCGECICHSWREAFLQLEPPPPPLPLLLVANAGEHAFHCVPSNWRTHPIPMPSSAHHRYFGSYDGGWLFLSISQSSRHVLQNLNKNDNVKRFKFSLPDQRRCQILSATVDQQLIVIVAATLSCQPTEPGCVAAGIIDSRSFPDHPRYIAFWKIGETSISFPAMNQPEVEDLLYSSHGAGAFLFLTEGEHIREFPQPIFPPPGTAPGVSQELYFQPRGDDGGGLPVLARYLVESRDNLLMVVRLGTRESCTARPRHRRSQSPPPPPTPTTAFQVFQREDQKVKSINDIDGVVQLEHSWIKLPDLEGRMLFVGRGCSRSYEADGYPGMEGVYFLDDRSFYDRTNVFKNDAKRKYYRSDIGKWSGSPPQVRHNFPEQVLNHVHNEVDRVADRMFDGIVLRLPPRRLQPLSCHAICHHLHYSSHQWLMASLRHGRTLSPTSSARSAATSCAYGLCSSWRDALLLLEPPPPPLPRLVLPEADGPAFYCVPSGCLPHRFVVPHAALHARCFGSYDGAWLFHAVEQAANHVLLNLITHQQLNLPNLLRVPSLVLPGLTFEFEVAIVAATLSRRPTDQGCVGAGIICFHRKPLDSRHIAFWRMGDEAFSESFQSAGIGRELELEVVDLLYGGHGGGAFLFLTRGENIRVFRQPIFPLRDMQTALLYFERRGDDDDDDGWPVIDRYLVESREKLLMVVRLRDPQPGRSSTTAFRVFQREDQLFISYWTKLPDLDGRMLFVGRGCSRSYEAADGYPGMEGVYFLDDRSFHDPMVVFMNAAEQQYPCSDNGRWSGAPPPAEVERCFPEQGPSNYSPPIPWQIRQTEPGCFSFSVTLF